MFCIDVVYISAVRFCGGTFAYTAVSVLLNYSKPWCEAHDIDLTFL